MRRNGWMALGLALLTVAAARAVDTDSNHMIIPGERIGPIELGMNAKQVHDAMAAIRAVPMATAPNGQPGAWRDDQADASIEGYQTDPIGHDHYGNMMKVFYVNNKVAQISTQSVAYVTSKGGVTRLTSPEFRRLHPSLSPLPVRESWGGNVRAYDSRPQGLSITYNVLANGREAISAQEIFVHLRGEPFRFESSRRILQEQVNQKAAEAAKDKSGDAEAGAEKSASEE